MQHTMMKKEKLKIYASPRRTENEAIHSTSQRIELLSSMSQLMMVQEDKRVRYIFFVKSDALKFTRKSRIQKFTTGDPLKFLRSKNKNGCCNREITGNWRNVPKGNFAGNRD